MKRPSNRFWVGVGLVLVMLLILRYCSFTSHKKPPGIPVVTAVSKTADMPITLLGLGAVTPTDNVTIKTLVNGLLTNIYFKEGDMVKAGDLLGQIDPRPYQAQLVQYQGELERDQALLATAKVDLIRYQNLWKQNSVAKQVLDTQANLVVQYEGAVQLDLGLIQSVKVNLIYCQVLSPVDGRIGIRLVDQGNYVQTSDTTGIVVITTLNPMTVLFTLPEDDIPQVMKAFATGKPIQAQAYNRDQTKLLATGTLLSMDTQVDSTTGTVKLRATFNNQNNVLFPQQFVNVKLTVDTIQNATVIPTAAIQYGVNNTYVFVVNADNTVVTKPVTVGVTQGDETSVTGIAPGQSVVVEGGDKLVEGSTVVVASDPPPGQAKA